MAQTQARPEQAARKPGRRRPQSQAAKSRTHPKSKGRLLLFGRYRLEVRLGTGGSAEVWSAHDEQLDRPVALKILHRHLLPDAASRRRFQAEARAAARL